MVRRIRLTTTMLIVAAVALILGIGLGLDRRGRRLEAVAFRYSFAAADLENQLVGAGPAMAPEASAILDQVHRNDALAAAYLRAAARPWVPIDPDPSRVVCECSYHVQLRAVANR